MRVGKFPHIFIADSYKFLARLVQIVKIANVNYKEDKHEAKATSEFEFWGYHLSVPQMTNANLYAIAHSNWKTSGNINFHFFTDFKLFLLHEQ